MPTPPSSDFPLPANLPAPLDDGAARHLLGMAMPKLSLLSTAGNWVDLSQLKSPRTVLYCYPMTGVPGKALPDGWDAIPGARGCTPQACGFRDHWRDLSALNAFVFGVSVQATEYQAELARRLHLPFEILSDAQYKLCDALRLPTFEVDGLRLLKRLTLVVSQGRIEQVFYPVFPPNESAGEVIRSLSGHAEPTPSSRRKNDDLKRFSV